MTVDMTTDMTANMTTNITANVTIDMTTHMTVDMTTHMIVDMTYNECITDRNTYFLLTIKYLKYRLPSNLPSII